MMEACPICGYPETHENMPTEELEEDEDHGYCAVCGRNVNGKYIYNVYEEEDGEMENQISRITAAIYSEELDRCAYTVGQTMSGEWFFVWGSGIGAGENIPNELLQDPENIRGAYVGRKEEIRGEIEDCFFDPDPASWGSEDQQEAAEVVVAALLRGLEEASKILILPEPPVDPERAEFVRLCLGGPDVDLGPCPVCGDEDCRKDHLEGEA